VFVLALIAAAGAWALLARERVSEEPTQAAVQPGATGPRIVTADGLSSLAALRGLPVYWIGARANALYEVTQTAKGYVYVRYLPSGTAPGDPRAAFLTIGTYSRADAYGDIQAAARRPGAVTLHLREGGLAVYDVSRPTSIFLAYPGSSEQVEIYDPSPAVALRIVERGRIRPVP
jgi:hypothetical protein